MFLLNSLIGNQKLRHRTLRITLEAYYSDTPARVSERMKVDWARPMNAYLELVCCLDICPGCTFQIKQWGISVIVPVYLEILLSGRRWKQASK